MMSKTMKEHMKLIGLLGDSANDDRANGDRAKLFVGRYEDAEIAFICMYSLYIMDPDSPRYCKDGVSIDFRRSPAVGWVGATMDPKRLGAFLLVRKLRKNYTRA